MEGGEGGMKVLGRQDHVVGAASTAGEGKVARGIALRLGRNGALAIDQLHRHVGEPFLSRLDLADLAATAGDEIAPDDTHDAARLARWVYGVLRPGWNLRNRKPHEPQLHDVTRADRLRHLVSVTDTLPH